MFLHLGADMIIPLKSVISISDRKEDASPINNDFLHIMSEEGMIVDVSGGNVKSFVVTDDKVYLSAISSLTLKKRAGAGAADSDDE